MLMRTELEDLFFLATLLEKMPSEMRSSSSRLSVFEECIVASETGRQCVTRITTAVQWAHVI